jgi:hypothetical protein
LRGYDVLVTHTKTAETVRSQEFPLSFIGSPESFHSLLQEAVFNAKKRIGWKQKSPDSEPSEDDDLRNKPE